jgi:hypothetical protein
LAASGHSGLQLAAYGYLPLRVDAMDLKNRLCMSRPMTVTVSICVPGACESCTLSVST